MSVSPKSLMNKRPVCARPPASQFLRHRVELIRMSGDSGVGSGVLMLEWRSPGEEGVVLLGSFYSGCCGLFVPDDLTAFITHHAVAPLAMPAVLVVRRAPAGGGCRPYLCQVGCTTPGVLRTSGRLSLSIRMATQRHGTPSLMNASQRDFSCRGGQIIAFPPRPGRHQLGCLLDLGATVDY
ncbi:hypothetical protein BHE74_00005231 [Ensete ventricosum]|nr:hypothetical protein BHE74_00005231 [Ensete ventricosum]